MLLTEELTLTRRVRLHASIAETLQQLYGDNAEAHAAELAHHFAEAEAVLGSGKLGRYASLSGDRALATYAYEEALGHFERALVAKGVPLSGREPAKDSEDAGLLFGLGRAQLATIQRPQIPEAVAKLTRAFDYYALTKDVDRAVSIASHMQEGTTLALRGGMDQLLFRALEMVPPESHEAGRLLTHYGLFLGTEGGDYDGAQRAFDRALNIAHRMGDVSLEARLLAAHARVNYYNHLWQESLELGLKAVELASQTGELRFETDAYMSVVGSLCILGDMEGARKFSDPMLAAAERLRALVPLAGVLWRIELIAFLDGDWDSARAFSDRMLLTSSMDARGLGSRALTEYQVGDLEQGNSYLTKMIETVDLASPVSLVLPALLAEVIPLAARIADVPGEHDLVRAAADATLSAQHPIPTYALVARAGLALSAVLRDDSKAAEDQYPLLLTQRGTWIPYIAMDRVLGLLSHTMGNLDRAGAHFEDALAFCRKAGYRPELAWTCCDYADTLLQRNEPGDRPKAMSLLDESLAISSELGMRPLMERVLCRRDILRA